MVGAGILAKNAVKRGLRVKPYVKTSLAPDLASPSITLKKPAFFPTSKLSGFTL